MIELSALVLTGTLFFLLRHMWDRHQSHVHQMEKEWLDHVRNGLSEQFMFVEPRNVRRFMRFVLLMSLLLSFVVLSPLPLLIASGIAFGLPFLVLRWLRTRRQNLFVKQLGTALPQISSILHAGHTFERAIECLIRTQAPPLNQELEMVAKEIRLGTPLDEALEHLHERYPSRDLEMIARAVGISRRIGSNLSEVFDRVAEMIRARAALRGRLSALTAQGRMQAWIAIAMPIAMTGILQFIAPDYLQPLFTTRLGHLTLGLAAVGLTVGGFWIQRIAQSEVMR